jgi:hypothetical protein
VVSKKPKEQISAEADSFADAAIEHIVGQLQAKDREKQFQEEMTYTHKREIAHEPRDPEGHSWNDKEFSQVYRHAESSATLAFSRLSALRNLKERLDHVERLVSNAIDEMPEPNNKHQVGVVAQLAGALAILRQQRPNWASDVRIWSESSLCAICNCAPCRERMEHYAKYGNGYSPDQPEAPQCCRHEDATLFLPF